MTSTPKPALRSPFERARQDAIPAPLDVCLQKGVFGMFKSLWVAPATYRKRDLKTIY